MWLFTDIGFFSIVRKPADENDGMVTISARVHSDLERLREFYLPSLGDVLEKRLCVAICAVKINNYLY